MGNTKERRFIFRSPSSSGDTLLRFREPTETAADELFARIVDGSYDKPFLVEDLEFRAMCFALDGCTQSEMRLDDPVALVSEYTRKMMGFLLFRARPQRILMIGLGGGSLVKFCHRHLPTTHITAVEMATRFAFSDTATTYHRVSKAVASTRRAARTTTMSHVGSIVRYLRQRSATA